MPWNRSCSTKVSHYERAVGRQGIYLVDEPEAALSPQRQLAFLRLIRQMVDAKEHQFLKATHSPITPAP